MNNPKSMGFSEYKIHRFGSLGLFSNPHNLISNRKNYGRPLRKASRIGEPKGLNKTGHRHNKG